MTSNNDKTFIFLHIPKTGGSSLVSLINMNYRNHEIFAIGKESYKIFGEDWGKVPFQERQAAVEKKFKNLSARQRNSYKIIIGHISYGWHEFVDNSVYATYLRNPESRVISLYKYILRRNEMELSQRMTAEDISLGQFVKEEMHWEVSNAMVKRLAAIDTITPENQAEVVNIAKKRLNDFQYVGLTEYFDDSVLLMKELMDFRYLYIEKQNVSPKSQDFKITDLDKAVLRQKNQLDADLFDFAEQRFLKQKNDFADFINGNHHLLNQQGLNYKLRKRSKQVSRYLERLF